MSNQKSVGKSGGHNHSYDKGKGKGSMSSDPWSLYNPFQSKGEGKGQGGIGNMSYRW